MVMRCPAFRARLIPCAALGAAFLVACAPAPDGGAALSPRVAGAVATSSGYDVRPNVPYDTSGGKRLVLDAYVPFAADEGGRTLVYVHGGGWVWDTKERNALELLPFLAQGWTVVSVEYRRADEAPAPAAVADVRCAFRWVAAHAADLKVDPERIVAAGHSAGGHLALMAALPPVDSDFDEDCPWPEGPPVAAVVNWFGITDVADLLTGVNERDFAVRWIGAAPNAANRAATVSPLRYVDGAEPPVITIHGDADATVPFSHGLRLHAALDAAGVPNRLVRVRGGDHGDFAAGDLTDAYRAVFDFLARHGYERTAVDGEDVLARIRTVPVSTWIYTDQPDGSVRHIGPVAQDWHRAFGFSADSLHINSGDLDGVNLAAAHALLSRTDALRAADARHAERVRSLEGENEALRASLSSVLARLQR